MDRLLPLRALTRLLAVEEAAILAWIVAGQFPSPVTLPNGELRWRSCAVAAWQATLGAAREHRAALAREQLPELAQEILQVLEEAEEEWLTAADVAARVGGDADHTSGSWRRAARQLREAGLIDTDQRQGMRLVRHAASLGPDLGIG